MERVARFWLDVPEDIRELKACMANIMEWGLGERLGELRKELDAIAARDKEGRRKGKRKRKGGNGGAAGSSEAEESVGDVG